MEIEVIENQPNTPTSKAKIKLEPRRPKKTRKPYVKRSKMSRLNSGIKNRQNFFPWSIFLFQKIGNDSVNHADSGGTKILVQFPGNPIKKFSLNF